MALVVPLVDLGAQYASIRDDIDAAVARVLESGQFVLGPEVAAFEEQFAAYVGARHAVATASGTSALHLALLAAGVGPGDEVITVPFTFVATVAAIEYTAATPVLVDIEERYCTMDPIEMDKAITARTRAIIPVHLYGQSADMDAITSVARRHGLAVIEDAAQAHGAIYNGRFVGTIGDLGCFSFYPTKVLGAYGEGGIVVTDDGARAAQVRRLRDWGQTAKHTHAVRGFNARMDALQGAVLQVKLRRLESWIEARRRIALQYDNVLSSRGVGVPAVRPGSRHVYSTYTIRYSRRERLAEWLKSQGIQTEAHYPTPVHLQPAYASLGYRPDDFPRAERAAKDVLSLPIYPELSPAQIDRVCEAIQTGVRDATVDVKI